ncbi:class II aldolase/adducin family protein [[Clostridium] polysaccharolyticum]|uniref:L-fuculose-phosphate aldolase n=1 Tax=[Clostridium] polysaccharolyticum TaxID=29364 RepID=A0A1I0DIY6_9FIRM|nr:class II aldolase/adducin family protein [[Clostridium] polysaccharolyticum]SET32418.1 L-fuculose-phosphate aldolase [[Clostridium] polysaccharolyticum]
MSNEQKKYPSDQEAKNLILEVGRRMYEKNYVVSNDGNITCKVSDYEVWATPTGVSKGFMKEEMLSKMDLDGNVIEGTYKISSEVKMHLRIYKENEDIRAVVHAHPLVATSFSIAGIPLDSRTLAEGVVQLGVVPCTPFAMPGSNDVPDFVAPYCKEYNAVLLGNHGAVTWGDDLMQAYYRMESLEYFANILLNTRYIIGKANEFTDEQVDGLIAIRQSLGIKRGGRPS